MVALHTQFADTSFGDNRGLPVCGDQLHIRYRAQLSGIFVAVRIVAGDTINRFQFKFGCIRTPDKPTTVKTAEVTGESDSSRNAFVATLAKGILWGTMSRVFVIGIEIMRRLLPFIQIRMVSTFVALSAGIYIE